jgi:hypothetical protein
MCWRAHLAVFIHHSANKVCQVNLKLLHIKILTKLVLAWAELHQDELMADWELVMNGEEPFKIQPLQ